MEQDFHKRIFWATVHDLSHSSLACLTIPLFCTKILPFPPSHKEVGWFSMIDLLTDSNTKGTWDIDPPKQLWVIDV